MKNGKKPTVKQCNIIRSNGLNPDNWFVSKVFPDRLELVHRQTDGRRIVFIR